MNNNNNFLIPFYKKIVLDFNIKDHADIGIRYNLYQYVGYYAFIKGIDITPPIESKLSELIWHDISNNTSYYKPLIFDSLVALKCNLFPFQWQGKGLLATSSCITYLPGTISPRLDAYQALTNNTIDENSYLFSDFDCFQSVIGKELTEKVLQAISYTINKEV